jgi:hypothetical protein
MIQQNDTLSTAKVTAQLALATAAVFLLLLITVLIYGISQQYFEGVHDPTVYTEQLRNNAAALNLIFVLDNIFIVLYTSMALFAVRTWRVNAPAFISRLVFVLMVSVGMLDFLENFHIYALLQQSKTGIPVSEASIRWQSAESMMKWHIAYLAFFLLGFLVPAINVVGKLLKYSLWFLFVPIGVLVYATVDTQYAALFQWLRYGSLLTGFISIGLLMRKDLAYRV